jgi:hypothetical protein
MFSYAVYIASDKLVLQCVQLVSPHTHCVTATLSTVLCSADVAVVSTTEMQFSAANCYTHLYSAGYLTFAQCTVTTAYAAICFSVVA